MKEENDSRRNSMRMSKSSLKQTGNDIINSNVINPNNTNISQVDLIKEGKYVSSAYNSKRKAIVGLRPDNTNNTSTSNNIRRNSHKDLTHYSEIDEEDKVRDSIKKEYDQDILTKQAIEEIKDNITSFKLDINKYVQELREEQEKIELGDIKNGIKVLSEGVEKDLKATRNQNEKDFQNIKESFAEFRDEVFTIIDNVAKENEERISELYKEIKQFEVEVTKKFTHIEKKQNEYVILLKKVLQTTNDEKTKQIVKQFLIDDKEVYELNKERNQKEFEEERKKEQRDLEERERKKIQIRIRAEEDELAIEAKEEEELRLLEIEMKIKEDELLRRKEYEIQEITKEEKVFKEKEEKLKKEEEEEIKKDEEERKIEEQNKGKLTEAERKININSIQLQTLKDFSMLYPNGEIHVKKYIKETVKMTIVKLLKMSPLDLTRYRESTVNAPEIKEKVGKINILLKGFMDDLIGSVASDKVPLPVKIYLKFILTDNHFIPFKFFSMFELSRLFFQDGLLISISNHQKEMIVIFYLIMKVLIKSYFIEYNFLVPDDKLKLDELSKVNIKIIASVLYHTIIGMFRGLCPIQTTISNVKEFQMKQCEDNDDLGFINENITKTIITGYPDTDPNSVDYLQMNLFTSTDLSCYWSALENTEFELGRQITLYTTKFIELVSNFNSQYI